MIEAPSVQVGQGLIHRVAAFSSSPPLYLNAPPLPHHGEDLGGDGKGRGHLSGSRDREHFSGGSGSGHGWVLEIERVGRLSVR